MHEIEVIFHEEVVTYESVIASIKKLGWDFTNIPKVETSGVVILCVEFASYDSACDFIEKFYENYFTSIADVDYSDIYLNSRNIKILGRISHLHSYALSNIVKSHDDDLRNLNDDNEMLKERVAVIESCINKNSLQNVRNILQSMVNLMVNQGYVDEHTMNAILPNIH